MSKVQLSGILSWLIIFHYLLLSDCGQTSDYDFFNESSKETSIVSEDSSLRGVSDWGISYRIPEQYKNIKVIDMHLHAGSFDAMGEIGQAFILNALPSFIPSSLKKLGLSALSNVLLNPYGFLFGIKDECKRGHIAYGGLLALYAPRTWGNTTNERLQAWLDDHRNELDEKGNPFFFGLASLPIEDDWDHKGQQHLNGLRDALAHPYMRGIKLALIHNNIRLDDTRYAGIYELASEMNVPVYHHIGSSPLRRLTDLQTNKETADYLAAYNPNYLEWAIQKYPNTIFILGHMGFDFNHEGYYFLDDVLRLARTYPNVYLEISAFGKESHDPDGQEMDKVLALVREQKLIDKTIYGSDQSGAPGVIGAYLQMTLKSMGRLKYSTADASSILADNARRIFRFNP